MEFLALRCHACQTFVVQQATKTRKWACRMCGVKQSIVKVYGRNGSAAAVRGMVQRLSMTQGQAAAAAHDPDGDFASSAFGGGAFGGDDQGYGVETAAGQGPDVAVLGNRRQSLGTSFPGPAGAGYARGGAWAEFNDGIGDGASTIRPEDDEADEEEGGEGGDPRVVLSLPEGVGRYRARGGGRGRGRGRDGARGYGAASSAESSAGGGSYSAASLAGGGASGSAHAAGAAGWRDAAVSMQHGGSCGGDGDGDRGRGGGSRPAFPRCFLEDAEGGAATGFQRGVGVGGSSGRHGAGAGEEGSSLTGKRRNPYAGGGAPGAGGPDGGAWGRGGGMAAPACSGETSASDTSLGAIAPPPAKWRSRAGAQAPAGAIEHRFGGGGFLSGRVPAGAGGAVPGPFNAGGPGGLSAAAAAAAAGGAPFGRPSDPAAAGTAHGRPLAAVAALQGAGRGSLGAAASSPACAGPGARASYADALLSGGPSAACRRAPPHSAGHSHLPLSSAGAPSATGRCVSNGFGPGAAFPAAAAPGSGAFLYAHSPGLAGCADTSASRSSHTAAASFGGHGLGSDFTALACGLRAGPRDIGLPPGAMAFVGRSAAPSPDENTKVGSHPRYATSQDRGPSASVLLLPSLPEHPSLPRQGRRRGPCGRSSCDPARRVPSAVAPLPTPGAPRPTPPPHLGLPRSALHHPQAAAPGGWCPRGPANSGRPNVSVYTLRVTARACAACAASLESKSDTRSCGGTTHAAAVPVA